MYTDSDIYVASIWRRFTLEQLTLYRGKTLAKIAYFACSTVTPYRKKDILHEEP